MLITTTCVLRQTTTFVRILRNRSIKTAESRHTENTLVNVKQIEQLLLMTVSNDEKPMSFLHSDISFGTLIRKQAFDTRFPAFSAPAFLTVPHFPVSHFQSPRE